MHAPAHKTPTSLADYLDGMSRAVFSSGINWKVIDAKWAGIEEAFDGFDPEKVAAYTPNDVERLMGDTRVVRNHAKIEAVIANAGELIVVDREYGGFRKYLGSFDDNAQLIADLHKRFKFLGPSVAHVFLYRVEFDMPAQEQWAMAQFGDGHPQHAHR